MHFGGCVCCHLLVCHRRYEHSREEGISRVYNIMNIVWCGRLSLFFTIIQQTGSERKKVKTDKRRGDLWRNTCTFFWKLKLRSNQNNYEKWHGKLPLIKSRTNWRKNIRWQIHNGKYKIRSCNEYYERNRSPAAIIVHFSSAMKNTLQSASRLTLTHRRKGRLKLP